MEVDFKGLVFDLDGVICHTDIYHQKAWKETMKHHRIPFEDSTNDLLRGVSRKDSLEIILRKAGKMLSEEKKAEILEEKNNLYREYLADMSDESLDPKVLDTLRKLKNLGYSMAVGSSSKNTKYILDRIGLGTFFDAVADGTMITKSKPDPEVFLLAAKMLLLDPKECLVIEDAESGINAALAGGFWTAGIGNAAKMRETDYMLSEFSDLLLFL